MGVSWSPLLPAQGCQGVDRKGGAAAVCGVWGCLRVGVGGAVRGDWACRGIADGIPGCAIDYRGARALDLHVSAVGRRQGRAGEIGLAGKAASEFVRRRGTDDDVYGVVPSAILRWDAHGTNEYQNFEHRVVSQKSD